MTEKIVNVFGHLRFEHFTIQICDGLKDGSDISDSNILRFTFVIMAWRMEEKTQLLFPFPVKSQKEFFLVFSSVRTGRSDIRKRGTKSNRKPVNSSLK